MSDLEQDEKPTAWRSMESAPKDGREILVRDINGDVWVALWSRWTADWQDIFGAPLKSFCGSAWTDIPS